MLVKKYEYPNKTVLPGTSTGNTINNHMRIIAFGCSRTQGIGLEPHTLSPETLNKSQLAWPALLGKKLSCEFINKGAGGSCNKQITYAIMKFKYRPGDVVIIMWTDPERHSLLVSPRPQRGHSLMHGAVWEEHRPYHDPVDDYFRYVYRGIYDSQFLTSIYMNQAHLYLNSQGIKNYHAECADNRRVFFPWVVPEILPGLPGISYAKKHGIPENEIFALDGAHIGPWAHEEFAQRMVDNHLLDAIL